MPPSESAESKLGHYQGGKSLVGEAANLPDAWDQSTLAAEGQRTCLGGAFSAGSQLANVVQEDRALQCVELGGVVRDLRKEGVGHENGGLILVAVIRIAEQDRDVHLQGVRQARERGERRHGLGILDLRNVSAGYVHASRKLTLGKIADMSQIANGSCDLELSIGCGENRNQNQRSWS